MSSTTRPSPRTAPHVVTLIDDLRSAILTRDATRDMLMGRLGGDEDTIPPHHLDAIDRAALVRMRMREMDARFEREGIEPSRSEAWLYVSLTSEYRHLIAELGLAPPSRRQVRAASKRARAVGLGHPLPARADAPAEPEPEPEPEPPPPPRRRGGRQPLPPAPNPLREYLASLRDGVEGALDDPAASNGGESGPESESSTNGHDADNGDARADEGTC